jgi:hypothetical protein
MAPALPVTKAYALFSGSLNSEANKKMAHWILDKSTGVVTNSIVCDDTTSATGWLPPNGQELVEFNGACGIGWIWDGTTMTDPNPPAPERLLSEKTRVR